MAAPSHLPSIPLEILYMIGESLAKSDLKSMRLVCKPFSDTIAPLVFHQVYLSREKDSFERLQNICAHPEFRWMVRALTYSGKMLEFDRGYPDYLTWSFQTIGKGFGDDIGSSYITKLKDGLDRVRNKYHYERFCKHFFSEQHLQKDGLEQEYLTDAFEKLPNLAHIMLDPGKTPSETKINSVSQLSRVGRESLVEPNFEGGRKFHGKQFFALLMAAISTGKRLRTIRAQNSLPWDIFAQNQEILDNIIETTRSCLQFSISIEVGRDKIYGTDIFAKMIANASFLEVLEISFDHDPDPYNYISITTTLSHLFEHRALFSCLRRLKLQGLQTSESYLRSFLTRHSSTLRSLKLANMELIEGIEADSSMFGSSGSWASIIRFLATDLRLLRMKFKGNFTNTTPQGWCVRLRYENWRCCELHVGGDDPWRRSDAPSGESCLKYRIEKFIVEGGECPLDQLEEDGCALYPYDTSWSFSSPMSQRRELEDGDLSS